MLDPAQLPGCGGSPGSWAGERGAGLESVGGAPSLYIHGSSFLAWGALPAEPVTVGWGSRERRGGEHGLGSLGLGLLLVLLGKKPSVSRVRFGGSSLAALSLLAGGLLRAGAS